MSFALPRRTTGMGAPGPLSLRHQCLLALFVGLSWIRSLGSATESTLESENDYPLPHETCDLYLAKSTIPNAGLGIYSAIERHVGEKVGDGDMCIPLIDMNWHNERDTWFWALDDYVWGGHVMGMAQESSTDDIEAYCPGLDCAINCNLALINVGKADPQYDISTQLWRHRDPGVGTFTPYHNGSTLVEAEIPAGGELFKFYGDNWFETRFHVFGLLPLRENYEEAETIVTEFDMLSFPSNDAKKDFWEHVVKAVSWESRTSNALPNSFAEAMVVAESGIRALHQPNATRSKEWLIENGRCIDHLEPRPQSTLPQAARGAFAKHYLPKDTIITSSPLLTIVDPSNLNIYEWEDLDGDGSTERNIEKVIGKQVLLNYVFGHPDTSLLLVPYGASVNYINHNQTLANVKVQWSEGGFMPLNNSWFDLTPAEMKWNYKTSLAIDFVAIRDILPGDEVFLDYGDAFEVAWQNHVDKWESYESVERFAPAELWNHDLETAVIRTWEEQELDPYPDNLLIRCHPTLSDPDWEDYFESEEFLWNINEKGSDCSINSRYLDDDEDEFVYDVTVHGNREIAVAGVPRIGLRFIDKVESTDLHLLNVFRHEMHLPDEMVPEKWRDMVPIRVEPTLDLDSTTGADSGSRSEL